MLCPYAECSILFMIIYDYAKCHDAECHYAENLNAECHYALCRGIFEHTKQCL
jgi:hypothetical protein